MMDIFKKVIKNQTILVFVEFEQEITKFNLQQNRQSIFFVFLANVFECPKLKKNHPKRTKNYAFLDYNFISWDKINNNNTRIFFYKERPVFLTSVL